MGPAFCRTMQACELKQDKHGGNRFTREKIQGSEEIITKTVKKLTNYLHNQEKVTIFAASFKQVINDNDKQQYYR